MHNPAMALWRSDVARILEGDPRVPGFKQHGQHTAPQINRTHGFEIADLAAIGARLIRFIGGFEGRAIQIMQVECIVWRKQGPGAVCHHPFHEQVRHPVGGVHVMGASPVIAGVFAQIKELFDVDMPRFEIGTDSPLALAALIDRNGGIVGNF